VTSPAIRLATFSSASGAQRARLQSILREMKYAQLRRGLSPEEAAAYVGSKELLRQFELAKWLKPFIRGNCLTRFDIRDLDECIDRLKAGELLPNPRAA
jgi:hypothetical protein